MSGRNLNELLQLRKINDDEFETTFFPICMGSSSPIAYGGCSLGVAAAVAYQTVFAQFHAYSLMGNFLGPALTDRNFHCSVRRARDTRTFATRHVEVSQMQDDGKRRPCLFMTADFQTREPVDLMTFSAPPIGSFKPPLEEKTPQEWRQDFLEQGKVDAKTAEAHRQAMLVHQVLFEQRNCASGFSAQTLSAIGKHLPTDQDHLPITD